MASFDPSNGWQARCQQWLSLLREDDAAGLRALVHDMEKNTEHLRELVTQGDAVKRYRATLCVELDKLLARVRGEMLFAKQSLRPMTFSADDLREEARLCREEAAAADDVEMQRVIAAHAVEFAMLGEAAERAPVASDSWITRENIRHFRDQLKQERNPQRRTILEGLLLEQEAKLPADRQDRIRRWRMKAEELRTAADQMANASAQDSLRRTASTYERLAADAEARLTGEQSRSDKDAG